jgi:hypothetical protein
VVVTTKGRPERRADAGDLVFGLQGPHAEILVLGKLVQDVRRRRDRVRPEKQGQLGQVGRGEKPPGERHIAGHVRVGTREVLGGRYVVGGLEDLRGLAEVVAGPERQCVRLCDNRHTVVAPDDPALGVDDRPMVEPRQQSEREEVLAPLRITRLGPGRPARFESQRSHRDLVDPEGRQAAVFERVGLVARLGQGPLVK